MDRKAQNKKAKLNIIDIIIIFAVLICLAAIGLRIYFTSNANNTGEEALVTFEVYGISETNAMAFGENMKLYLASSDDEVGYIVSAAVSAAKTDAVDGDGKITSVNDPIKKTVVVTAVLKGKWGDDGFYLDGTKLLSLGTNVEIYTEKNIFSFTVLDVDNIE